MEGKQRFIKVDSEVTHKDISKRQKKESLLLRKNRFMALLERKRDRFFPEDEMESEKYEKENYLSSTFDLERVVECLKSKTSNSLSKRKLIKALKFGINERIGEFLNFPKAIPTLKSLLLSKDTLLQIKTLNFLISLTIKTDNEENLKLKLLFPILIAFLSSESSIHRDLSTWILGNIAAESASCRNTLISQGILTPLLSILETGKRQAKYLLELTGVHLAENQPTSSSITYRVIESTAFCLSNLCMGRSSLNLQDIIDCLPYIYNHIKENIAIAGHEDIVSEFCWVLTFLSSKGAHWRRVLTEKYGIDNLLEVAYFCSINLIKNKDGDASSFCDALKDKKTITFHSAFYRILLPVFRCLRNFSSDRNFNPSLILQNPKFFALLHTLLCTPSVGVANSGDSYLIFEILSTLQNLTVQEELEVGIFIQNEEILKTIIELISNSDPRLSENSLVICCNLADLSANYAEFLISSNIMQAVNNKLRQRIPVLAFISFQLLELLFSQSDRAALVFQNTSDGLILLDGYRYDCENNTLSEMAEFLWVVYFNNKDVAY